MTGLSVWDWQPTGPVAHLLRPGLRLPAAGATLVHCQGLHMAQWTPIPSESRKGQFGVR